MSGPLDPLALDLSLTASGWARGESAGVLSPPSQSLIGPRRLAWIRDQVLELAHGVDLIAIEGYALGSARGASRSHATGELGGVVRLAIWEASIPFVVVPPASLKKYATGKGNSGKPEVLAAAIRRLGYLGHDDNEADALWLLQMARARYGLPGAIVVPAGHRAALEAIDWPENFPHLSDASL